MSETALVEFDIIYLLEKFAPGEFFTPQQILFITYFMTNGFHRHDAAVSAGYSEKGASVQASRLLSLEKIKAVVQGYFSLLSMSRSELIGRLAQQARNEGATHLMQSDKGTLDALRDAGLLHLVRKYRQTDKGWSIEFLDPQKALTLLGKELGAWNADASEAPTINIDRFSQDLTVIFGSGEDASINELHLEAATHPPRPMVGDPELLNSGKVNESQVIDLLLQDADPVAAADPPAAEGSGKDQSTPGKK